MNAEIKEGIIRGKDVFKRKISEGKTTLSSNITEFKNHDSGIKKKILISVGLGATVFGVNWGLISALAIKNSGLIPLDWNTGAAIAGSWAFNIASTLINLNQQRRLLQNQNIDLSQDVPATVVFHSLLNKVKSLKESRGKRSITAISASAIGSNLISFAAKESMVFSMSALLTEGMSGVILLKSMQGASNLAQAGIAEVALRIKNREKSATKKIGSLPASAVIVDIKQDL